jgi:hypothetical protein
LTCKALQRALTPNNQSQQDFQTIITSEAKQSIVFDAVAGKLDGFASCGSKAKT